MREVNWGPENGECFQGAASSASCILQQRDPTLLVGRVSSGWEHDYWMTCSSGPRNNCSSPAKALRAEPAGLAFLPAARARFSVSFRCYRNAGDATAPAPCEPPRRQGVHLCLYTMIQQATNNMLPAPEAYADFTNTALVGRPLLLAHAGLLLELVADGLVSQSAEDNSVGRTLLPSKSEKNNNDDDTDEEDSDSANTDTIGMPSRCASATSPASLMGWWACSTAPSVSIPIRIRRGRILAWCWTPCTRTTSPRPRKTRTENQRGTERVGSPRTRTGSKSWPRRVCGRAQQAPLGARAAGRPFRRRPHLLRPAPDARDGPAAVDVTGAAVTDAGVFPRRPARRHAGRVRGI